MDCTVSHTGYMYFGIWMKRNSTWGKQCNNVARKGSSEDKVNKSSIYLFIYFFFTVICVTYHIFDLNKCTLDKIQKRSKIIKNISTLFSLNCVSIKFCEKSRTILKRIYRIIFIMLLWMYMVDNNYYYNLVNVLSSQNNLKK